MSEWWTYTLSDFLMFSPRIYYRLFALYNAETWPGQIGAGAAGFALLILTSSSRRGGKAWTGRAVAALLILAWLWVAWAYLMERYATINWAAEYFAAGFVLQAALLAWFGLLRPGLTFQDNGWRAWAGFGLAAFALVIQPLIGPLLAGRDWAQIEIFGMTPDPTVTMTLGILLAADRLRWTLFALPLIWCAISGATAWTMEAPDAFVMPLCALLVLGVLLGSAVNARRTPRG